MASFPENCLGLRYPLTKAMYKGEDVPRRLPTPTTVSPSDLSLFHLDTLAVCEKYLHQYPEDADLLWEVESVGEPKQRSNIANKLQSMDLSSKNERRLQASTTDS